MQTLQTKLKRRFSQEPINQTTTKTISTASITNKPEANASGQPFDKKNIIQQIQTLQSRQTNNPKQQLNTKRMTAIQKYLQKSMQVITTKRTTQSQ